MLKYKLSAILLLLSYSILLAQIPAGYYDSAVGKKGAELKTAFHLAIKDHIVLEYYGSSTSFLTTDWHPGGYFWDMYSNNKRTSWSGSYLNREHNMPKSWWSTAPENTVAYTDLHNLYPSDATANTEKSNYPLGVVDGSPTFSNGVVKVGKNSFPGYTGVVFEPANEYKGDFARDYMYMVTSYEDYANNWRSLGTSSMLYAGAKYPVFKPYAVSLLLEWCKNDPVSEKEINRNNAVYKLQGNRNPFVDFPALSEYIWGKYIDEIWDGVGLMPDIDKTLIISYLLNDKKIFVKVNISDSSFYQIFSIEGKILITGNDIDAESKIDVSSLENGLYILKIYNANTRATAKFVVQ